MDKIKILVCGTNFGRFYLDACSQNEQLELKGILSRGSEESRAFAQRYGVPLYTDPEALPISEIDLILVAARSLITGGRSANTVKKLLEQGISVSQEQPVHVREVEDLIKSIHQENQLYYVNNFYRYMPAVKKFIYYVEKLRKEYKILRLHLSCSSQVLYPLVDILYDMFGGIEEFEIEKCLDGNMNILSGKLNGVPFVLNFYNEYSADNDGSLALFFDIKLDTDAGNLILNDPEGDIIWQSHLTYEKGGDIHTPKYQNLRPLECLFDGRAESYTERYGEIWPKAMAESMKDVYIDTLTTESAKERIQKTLKQCDVCGKITDAAGRPKKIEIPYRASVSLKEE